MKKKSFALNMDNIEEGSNADNSNNLPQTNINLEEVKEKSENTPIPILKKGKRPMVVNVETEEDQPIAVKVETKDENTSVQRFLDKLVGPYRLFIESHTDSLIQNLLNFSEGANKNQDLSFVWAEKEEYLKLLLKVIIVTKENINEKIKRDFHCEFKLIKLITETAVHTESLLKIPKSINNLNRYSGILPFSYNNVLVEDNPEDIVGNYINGSYISGPKTEDQKFFIATQGPVPSTFSRIWKLINNKKIALIIMLCKMEEDSRRKCDKYWPKLGESLFYDNLTVLLKSEEELIPGCIIMREITTTIEGSSRTIIQLQVTCWPDHDVPDSSISFSMLEILISYIDEYKTKYQDSPVMVHCSAGLGRTGCLIAIYNIVRTINIIKTYNKNVEEGKKVAPFFSVFNTVRMLREQRSGMLTSQVQYKFIYEFATEWIKRNFEF